MQSLFPEGMPLAGRGGSMAELTFRAGKMALVDKLLKPDTRKGTVKVFKGDDGLTHLQWLDRDTGALEDDLILFPGECKLEKVPQGNARVLILKFEGQADRNMFFWMQESNASRDEELCAQATDLINSEEQQEEGGDEQSEMAAALAASLAAAGGGAEATGAAAGEAQPSPAAAAAAATAAVATPPAAGGAPAGGRVGLGDLQAALGSFFSGEGAAAAAGMGAQGAGMMRAPRGPSLADILTPQAVIPMLQNLDVQERLSQYLPESHRSNEAVADLLQSPQFHQQLETFSHALQTGQLDLSQFGLSPGAGFSVADFLQQIDTQTQREADDKAQQEGGDA